MAKLIVLITARDDVAQQVGESWREAGAPGITLIEGHGLQRISELSRTGEILAGMMSLVDILRSNAPSSFILVTLLDNDQLTDILLSNTQAILGDLHSPQNGIFFVIDVERAVGIRYHNN